MKNLILIFFLGLLLNVAPSYQLSAQSVAQETLESTITQENPSETQKQTFFQKIGDKVDNLWGKAKDGGINLVIGLIVGLFAKRGWTLVIKKIANKGKTIMKEIGETFIGGSNFFNVLDNSIRSDGKLEENSIKELLKAGKEVIAEANDVIISIKPKKLV